MEMDSKGQVSLEYLLTVAFAVALVIGATVIALNMGTLSTQAKTRVLQYRDGMIGSLMG